MSFRYYFSSSSCSFCFNSTSNWLIVITFVLRSTFLRLTCFLELDERTFSFEILILKLFPSSWRVHARTHTLPGILCVIGRSNQTHNQLTRWFLIGVELAGNSCYSKVLSVAISFLPSVVRFNFWDVSTDWDTYSSLWFNFPISTRLVIS